MKMRLVLSLGLSALVMGGTMVGCTAGGDLGTASSRSQANADKAAANDAKIAGKFLAAGNHARAIEFAEAAVTLRPQAGDYRALLGESYLKAGRFGSASQALADALSLGAANSHAALNLALAQIGEGKWHEARQTIDAHATHISSTDRGLALALAGDPAAGVDVLMDVARSSETSAKVRQNLALALALAGRWQESRVVAGADMSPADVDQRMMQWATFAQPASASDQVAALLGVVPVVDPGQPVALALNAPSSVAVAAVDPVAVPEPVPTPVVMETAAAHVPTVAPVQVPVATIAAEGAFKVAAPPMKAYARAKITQVVARQPARGNYYVQLGAFDSAGVAKNAWGRAQRRFAALRQHTPAGMNFASNGTSFYRLSVGGFARADADAMCRQYRRRGGVCFVRPGAGDGVAQWIKPAKAGGVQVAAR